MDYGNAFVCVMGIGTVFFGLICIICLCYLMSFICRKFEKKPAAAAKQNEAPVEVMSDRQAVIAAVSAVIAEETGRDIKGLRILSFKKL